MKVTRRVRIRIASAAALVAHFLSNHYNNVGTFHHTPTNTTKYDLPPIYWINLDISTTRRDAMLQSFSALGIKNQTRVPARDRISAFDAWHAGQLILHPKIKLEAMTKSPPAVTKHIKNIYHYEEAACLLSHLDAIKRAYDAGHELALILEDDAMVSSFTDGWSGSYLDQAPHGWKILQFATIMPVVMKHGIHLRDPFISWQPYHWSTRAYLINRSGMQTLVDKAHSTSSAGEDIWRIHEEAPMVVSDEVIYALIGDTYTSTGLWIDSLEFNSTVQTDEENTDLMHSYGSLIVDDSNGKELDDCRADIVGYSLLVLMNLRIGKRDEIEREIIRIRQDSNDVCKFHQTCNWAINVVVTEPDLVGAFREMASSKLPSNVEVLMSVSAEPFNKFVHVEKFVDRLADYDLTLLKDNDQRISGFPWCTFVAKGKRAVISGPLRQSAEEALLGRALEKKRQYFHFHEAHEWFHYEWSSKLVAEVVPTEVPLLEMYFVLLDAKFARQFFRSILTPEFLDRASSWGPDYLWCRAAREWDGGRPSCRLVPVVSSHEDGRQIEKGDNFNSEGNAALDYFKGQRRFGRWMEASTKWAGIIGDKNLYQIEQACRRLLVSNQTEPFDLQSCATKTMLHTHANT